MFLDVTLTGFLDIFELLKNGVFSVFEVLRTTYLFEGFSLLSLFIIAIVFDLVFGTFFVTFNIRNNNTTKSDKFSSNSKNNRGKKE